MSQSDTESYLPAGVPLVTGTFIILFNKFVHIISQNPFNGYVTLLYKRRILVVITLEHLVSSGQIALNFHRIPMVIFHSFLPVKIKNTKREKHVTLVTVNNWRPPHALFFQSRGFRRWIGYPWNLYLDEILAAGGVGRALCETSRCTTTSGRRNVAGDVRFEVLMAPRAFEALIPSSSRRERERRGRNACSLLYRCSCHHSESGIASLLSLYWDILSACRDFFIDVWY